MISAFNLSVEILKKYPLYSAVTITFLLLSGFLEGISIVLIIPVISTVTGSEVGSGFFEQFIHESLDYFGMSKELRSMLIFLVVVVSIAALIKFTGGIQIGFVKNRIAGDLRRSLVNAILGARWGYSSQLSPGRINAALGIETEAAASIYTTVGKIIATGSQAAIGLGLSFAISVPITIAGLVFGIGSAALFSVFVTRTRIAAVIRKNAMARLSARTVEIMSSLKTIKAMGAEASFLPLVGIDIELIRKKLTQMNIYQRAVAVLPEPIAAGALAVGLFIYIDQMGGNLETTVALAILFSRSATAIRSLQKAYQNLITKEPSYEFVHGLISETTNAMEIFKGTKEPSYRHGITLRDLTIVYDGQSEASLENVSLRLPSTGLVTITGPSGAGKSTMVNAIAGIETATSGAIEIDGVPMPDLDMSLWRKNISYVPQEIFLFPESIRENVVMGNPDITDNMTKDALQKADAWQFVQELAKGIDTTIGQAGSKLSGGQRQRIAMARALVRAPRIIILDEPTAALDNRSELEICRNLRQISKDILVLIISHKQVLVDVADITIELKNSKLASITGQEQEIPLEIPGHDKPAAATL